MFNKFYLFCNNFISRHKLFVLTLIGLIIFFSIINLPRIKYDNNIETMLPADPDIVRSMQFLRDAGFSDKVVLSLSLTTPSRTTQELIQATDELAASFTPGSPVTAVTTGLSTGNIQTDIQTFLKFAPQIISSDELSRFSTQFTTQGVDNALRSDYNRLLTPAGSFLTSFIRQDPLGVKNEIILDLQKLSSIVGYGVIVENNHFVSKDGRHTILILDTPISLTDGFGSRKLIDYLDKHINELPAYVEATIVAGHMHSVSNEEVIKKDILRTVSIATLAFFIIFLLAFKDIRAIIFFLIPLAAVLVSINMASFFFSSLSYFVIGMGMVIIGIADDYGIHAYVAVHTTGSRKAVSQIVKPLAIAVFTTTSIFFTFFISTVRGYHQLALFAITSIFICFGFVLFILPHFLKEGGKMSISEEIKAPALPQSDWFRIIIWFVVLGILLFFSFRVRFSSDINQFDGASREILVAEQDFKVAWGIEEQPAMLVSAAGNEEDAFLITEEISQKAGEVDLTTFVSIWPSEKTRAKNALNWQEFWKQGREDRLKELIAQVGPKYNFSRDAFTLFFDGLYDGLDVKSDPNNLQFFKRLKEQFVIKRMGSVWVVSFFSDDDRSLKSMRSLCDRYPGAFVVSRKALAQSISNSIAREVLFLSCLAALLILVLTFLLLKNIKLTLISLVSVISGIIAITGTFSILNLPINAAVLFASMVVVGLCIDYGVFMLYSYQHMLRTGTVKAVWISASTTLIGASSLLFAYHPVLFSIGITLTSGLLAGFISSQFVLPALYRVWIKRKGLIS